jgi:hypothetical protein
MPLQQARAKKAGEHVWRLKEYDALIRYVAGAHAMNGGRFRTCWESVVASLLQELGIEVTREYAQRKFVVTVERGYGSGGAAKAFPRGPAKGKPAAESEVREWCKTYKAHGL